MSLFGRAGNLLGVFLTVLFSTTLAWAQAGIDGSTYEAEDFDVTEEGMLFDHSRTGLMYRRNLYIEGDNVTFLPQGTTSYNDTRDTRDWKIYISHWEQDPPSHITVWVRDETPYPNATAAIDLRVTIGQYDRAKNLIPASQVIRREVPLHKGINRIPVNVHNYAGDVVWVHLIGVTQKMTIEAFDIIDD